MLAGTRRWQDDAACAPHQRQAAGLPLLEWEAFFPQDGAGRARTVPPETAKICDLCPVREQCLHHALTNDEHGIWGGTTDAQRDAMLRHIQRVQCPTCGSRRLLKSGLNQACSGCGSSWHATTQPSSSRKRRPRLGLHRSYDHATRTAAVEMVRTPGPDGRRPSIASVARQLGINRECLRQWVIAAASADRNDSAANTVDVQVGRR